MASRSHLRTKVAPEFTPAPTQNVAQQRPFAPPASADAAPTLADVQAKLEHAQRFGQNLAHLAKTQPESAAPIIQAKLTIGTPGDKYEQEADRVAKQVVQRLQTPQLEQSLEQPSVQRESMPEEDELQMKSLVNQIQRVELPEDDELQMKPEGLQRETDPEEEDELQMKPMLQMKGGGAVAASDDLESAIHSSRGSGQPLAAAIRQPLEHAFGNVDFSGVTVHTNTQADRLNRSIQAKAFTTGQDIYFRQGAYQPGSRGGQELIAHELTHVVQQSKDSNTRGKTIQRMKGTAAVKATDNEFLLKLQYVSGHGGYYPTALDERNQPKTVVVPNGTTITFWLPHKAALSDWVGQQVEMGRNFTNLIELYKQEGLTLEVFEPGDIVPNYILSPGKGLRMTSVAGAKSDITDQTLTLAEIMNKYQGRNIHWCACRVVDAAATASSLWGEGPGNFDQETLERETRMAKIDYWKKTKWAGGRKNQENRQAALEQMRGTKILSDVKPMNVEDMQNEIKSMLASQPSKPDVSEEFGAYFHEYVDGGERDVNLDYEVLEEEIDEILADKDMYSRRIDRLDREIDELEQEQQTVTDSAEQEQIADKIADKVREINRLAFLVYQYDQELEQVRKEKEKYIKMTVHDPEWKKKWQPSGVNP